ncbi:MAG: hypothetical protein KC680_04600 [Candidatus Peregrinibacteria bacterium]|nr:hypothetical protein [Candidatus Peregrinibacteria bacterium]MCB9808534.1 hypothetical protein [Candidatus Peribacteria bacterium]
MHLQHHSITQEQWNTLSLCEQLGNIGSEVGRALSAREITCDYFVGGNEYSTEGDSLDRYFLQFAQAARLNR